MEILLWLVPSAVVTVAAMLWVAWWGRDGRGAVDRETAARRMGEALSREPRRRPGAADRTPPRRTPDRSTGVALRPSRVRPVVLPSVVAGDDPATAPEPGTGRPDGVSTGAPDGRRAAS